MKKILFVLGILLSLGAAAQDGIHFEHASWSDIKAKAIKENKLIFVDFYTQWCGPCYNMAKEVFVLESVGSFYNTNFVNAKIDAENGEGVELAKKYKVRSYPTLLFIDPKTEAVVHESSSRQEKATFLFTGASALDPKKRSPYLMEQMKQGNTNPEFLMDYAAYAASRYDRGSVDRIAEQLATVKGYSLENERVWNLFVSSVGGRDKNYFKELISSYDKLAAKYGKKAVDGKLFKEFSSCQDEAEFAAAPNFEGKDFLVKKGKAEKLVRAKSYEEAAKAIDELMANPGAFKEELCSFLRYTGRMINYGEYPEFWKKKCMSYTQYVAYNIYDKDDAYAQYEYASMLEKVIKSMPDADKYFPESIIKEPAYGNTEYSLRPADLKKKNPNRKK